MSAEEVGAGAGSAKKKKKKVEKFWKWIAIIVVTLSVMALVAIVLSQLFGTKETKTTSEGQTTKNQAMVCTATSPKEPFFDLTGASDVEHQIKVTYKNNKADKIAYEYEADFGSEDAVKDAEAKARANYNMFMGQNSNDFSVQYMPIGNELKINVFADVDDLGSKTARVFFISEDNFNKLDGYNIDELKEIFWEANLHCEIDDE